MIRYLGSFLSRLWSPRSRSAVMFFQIKEWLAFLLAMAQKRAFVLSLYEP
jgi:hypothetical protein